MPTEALSPPFLALARARDDAAVAAVVRAVAADLGASMAVLMAPDDKRSQVLKLEIGALRAVTGALPDEECSLRALIGIAGGYGLALYPMCDYVVTPSSKANARVEQLGVQIGGALADLDAVAARRLVEADHRTFDDDARELSLYLITTFAMELRHTSTARARALAQNCSQAHNGKMVDAVGVALLPAGLFPRQLADLLELDTETPVEEALAELGKSDWVTTDRERLRTLIDGPIPRNVYVLTNEGRQEIATYLRDGRKTQRHFSARR